MDILEGDHLITEITLVQPHVQLPALRLYILRLYFCRLSHPPIRTSINTMAKLLMLLMLGCCLVPAEGEIHIQNRNRTLHCS